MVLQRRVCLVQMHGPRETPNGTSHLGGAGFPVTPRLPRQGLAPTPAAGRACGMGGRAQPQARTVTDAATRGDPGPPLGPSLQSELLAAAVSRALVPCGTPVGRRRRCVDGAEAASLGLGGGRSALLPPAQLRAPPPTLPAVQESQDPGEDLCRGHLALSPNGLLAFSPGRNHTSHPGHQRVGVGLSPRGRAGQSPARSQGGVLLPGGELGPHSRVTR